MAWVCVACVCVARVFEGDVGVCVCGCMSVWRGYRSLGCMELAFPAAESVYILQGV